MKPVNPQKERIIMLVNQLLGRANLSIDQVVARMQTAGCELTRNTFENRFTTRVHQKPNISAEWLLALIHAFTDQLARTERCQPEEAIELAKLASLPFEHFTKLRHFFTETEFAQALEQVTPVSYFSIGQNTTLAVNSLTKNVSQKSQKLEPPLSTSLSAPAKAEWGEAPDITAFRDRTTETKTIEGWIVAEQCRLIGLFGMGGIGKTMLAARVAHLVDGHFDRLIWCSLRNAPALDELLATLLRFLHGSEQVGLPANQERRQLLVAQQLRAQRCLLVLDNCEALVEAEIHTDHYGIGYDSYKNWLRQLAEMPHRSCVLLVGREKPVVLAALESDRGPVRALRLGGLSVSTIQQLLHGKGLHGAPQAWEGLVARYSGNPLALKLATDPIRELFGGDIAAFLQHDTVVVQDVRDLLDQQFGRLSLLERDLLYWLAIEREQVGLDVLQENTGHRIARGELLAALHTLHRRSLLEQSQQGFSISSVILTYLTERLVTLVVEELSADMPLMLISFALLKAQAKEYQRDSQVRHLLLPILEGMARLATPQEIEQKLFAMLRALQLTALPQVNYCAGNLLNLLVYHNTDLRGRDFRKLYIRHADLYGVNLQDTNFDGVTFDTARFLETFASIATLAFSPDGRYLAAGMTNGEINLWRWGAYELHSRFHGHSDMVWTVAFSPDGKQLASGGEDQTIRVWDLQSGECLWQHSAHRGWVKSLGYRPDGAWLYSAGHDGFVRIWDGQTGAPLYEWPAHQAWIWSLALSADGTQLATASEDRSVKLWPLVQGLPALHDQQTLTTHEATVRMVRFTNDGKQVVTASFDHTIGIWVAATGQLRWRLRSHTNFIWSIALSPDSRLLASAGDDQDIHLWDLTQGQLLQKLTGHSNRVWNVAFSPDGKLLASGSDDQSLRLWDMEQMRLVHRLQGYASQVWVVAVDQERDLLASGGDDNIIRLFAHGGERCLHLLQGHTERVRSLAFSPDGTLLASGGDDQTVRIWQLGRNLCRFILDGHSNRVWSVAFSATGRQVISCSEDQTIRVWDIETGRTVRTFHSDYGRIWAVAPHPQRPLLVSGGDAPGLQVWDIEAGKAVQLWPGHQGRIWAVTFSREGALVASGGADHKVCLWLTETGHCIHTLLDHSDAVWAVAFSPDNRLLASGGDDQAVRIWEVETGLLLHTLPGHQGCIWTLAFLDNERLASGSQDETIRIWEVNQGVCTRLIRNERPYERMNITGVKGLTEAQKASLRALGAIEQE